MGAFSSCIRLVLDAESDVKIHVIEPTSVNNGVEPPAANREPQGSESSLQVPTIHRSRSIERHQNEKSISA